MTDENVDVYKSPEGIDDDRGAPPKKKGGIPKWLWMGCGIGCLGAIVLAVIGGYFAKSFVEEAMDPELQWPKLQRVLPFDERPESLEIEMGLPFGSALGFEQFVLSVPETGQMAIVYHFEKNQEQVHELMREKPQSSKIMNTGSLLGFEDISYEVQGEKVRGVKFTGIAGPGQEQSGPGVRLNLHDAGLDGVVVEIRAPGSEEIPSELEVEQFFSNFNLW